jgi:anaerobic dimethyl sulfoxide reductase subunit B (iron-sulfur subunit)
MGYGFYIDIEKCSGCYACAVACMDQNDLLVEGKGGNAWRRVYKVESGVYPEVTISFITLSCMHCRDAPCVMGCPTGALSQDIVSGMVTINTGICIGCHSCAIACPFGAPRFGRDEKMQKCNMCLERVNHGLEPACVHTCTTKALKFGTINEILNEVGSGVANKLLPPYRLIKTPQNG